MRFIAYTSDNLKLIRKELNLTQNDLAKNAGIAYVTVQHLEQAKLNNPTLDVLKKLSKALTQKANYRIIFYIEVDI